MRSTLAWCALILSLLAIVSPARTAKSGTPPRIGYLGTHTAWTQHFLDALSELGYKEGQNIKVEWRVVDQEFARLPGLATDLAGLQGDLIFVDSTLAALAARQATATTPTEGCASARHHRPRVYPAESG